MAKATKKRRGENKRRGRWMATSVKEKEENKVRKNGRYKVIKGEGRK